MCVFVIIVYQDKDIKQYTKGNYAFILFYSLATLSQLIDGDDIRITDGGKIFVLSTTTKPAAWPTRLPILTCNEYRRVSGSVIGFNKDRSIFVKKNYIDLSM